MRSGHEGKIQKLSVHFFGPEAWEPLAAGWVAFSEGDEDAVLLVHSDDGEVEPMPISVFFRSEHALRRADEEALSRARGRVLDVGAGVGALTLVLQGRGLSVTALEVVPEAIDLMRSRGVKDIILGGLEAVPAGAAFDTALLLMNGTTLAGTLEGFPGLLASLEGLLSPGGQVLLDSTDLTDNRRTEDSQEPAPPPQRVSARAFSSLGAIPEGYPGELQYQMEFRGVRGAPFPQLFLDPDTLMRMAEECGWDAEVVWEEGREFLARLVRISQQDQE